MQKFTLLLSALAITNAVAFSQDVVNPTRIEKEYFSPDKIFTETPFVDGKKNGVEKHYHYNGKIELEIPYVNDKITGVQREYSETGKLKNETTYVNDVLHGVQKEYDEKGKLLKVTPYVNGVENGVGKEFRNGEFYSQTLYRENRYSFEELASDLKKWKKASASDSLVADVDMTDGVYKTRNKKSKKWGMHQFFAEEIRVLVPAAYDSLSFFKAGVALIWNHGKAGVYSSPFDDPTLRETVPCIYDEAVLNEHSKNVSVKKNNAWGLLNGRTGEILVPLTYATKEEVPIDSEE